MKANKLLLCAFTLVCIFGGVIAGDAGKIKSTQVKKVTSKASNVSWTMLVYIAADNSLADYALYNMNDMSAGLTASKDLNVLVQWDKPEDNITWRYKITPGGMIEVGSIKAEMGYNPANELTASMRWAIQNYPANRYALVLWNHGSGIEDFYPAAVKGVVNQSRWLGLISSLPERGILYDDSQETCLTNQGLTGVLTQVKKMLGRNLDLIAMDACLMAMTEVAYQMNGLVNLFVGSQQTIPGYGYPYSQFINYLSLNPASTTPLLLAQNMVSSYKKFYTTQEPTPDFTLSAIDVSAISLIKQNIDQFINAVNACGNIDATKTKSMIVAARKASISFEMPEYIDLYSFYANVMKQSKKLSPKSLLILEKQNKATNSKPSAAFQSALTSMNNVIQDGLNKIGKVVLQKATGPTYSGAKGISIYYPSNGQIDASYQTTLFAQNTSWTQFIKRYH